MRSIITVSGIHPYDGYTGERFWTKQDNESTYDNPPVDNQCRVPLRPMSEIKEDFYRKCAEAGINQ